VEFSRFHLSAGASPALKVISKLNNSELVAIVLNLNRKPSTSVCATA
jgi:hypothetical protein